MNDANSTVSRGTLTGVGVGPGDPELVTLKAVRVIRESDVVIIPSASPEKCRAYQIAAGAYPEIAEKEIVCMPFPMTKDPEVLERKWSEIYARTDEILASGKHAAFLIIGDPAVYSTYTYIAARAKKNGYQTATVSGITSFCAAASACDIPLSEQEEEIHIIPGSATLEQAVELPGTKIFMKTGSEMDRLKDLLQPMLERGEIEVYAVSDCGMESEKRFSGTEALEAARYYMTVVIVKTVR